MEKKIQIFGYLSLSLGLSKPQVIEKYGSYANWIRTTNQYKVIYSTYKELTDSIEDVSDSYDFDLPIFSPLDCGQANETLLVDIIFGHSDRRTKLLSLIEYAKQKHNHNQIVLCVHDINMLGSSPKMIKENYLALLDAKIAVLFTNIDSADSIALSTTTFNLEPLSSDFNAEPYIKKLELTELSPRSMNWSGHNFRKAETNSFLDAYFLYQLYLIGDEEALILSRLSKNSFPAKSKELESRVISVFLPRIDSIFEIENNWFAKYPVLKNYYDLPRRCGKVSPDILLLCKAMSLPIEQLETMSTEELKYISVPDVFSSASIIPLSDIDFNKLQFIANRFNLPQINPPTFKRYCLRIIAANEKNYTSYYNRKNKDLCIAIHQLRDCVCENNLTEDEIQAEFDSFFESYYKEHEFDILHE